MPYESIFNDDEWSLLVGLPHAVLIAASAAEHNSNWRTLTEGEAGLAAIADGRAYGNPLVEAVASELVKRLGGDPDLREEPEVVVSPEDPANAIADCLRRGREATTVLAAKVDNGDAGAYRHWVVTIAEQVVEAAPSGIIGFGDQVSDAEQDFVRQLSLALGD